jgi:hypothetical protein
MYTFLGEDAMEESNFLDDIVEEIPEGELQTLKAATDKMVELQNALALLELKKKELSAYEVKLRTIVIPNLLLKYRMDSISLTGYGKIDIKEGLNVSVPEDESKRKVVFKFLVDNGGGALIKETLTVESAPESVKKVLQDSAVPFEETMKVNGNSFKSWAKEVLGMKKGFIQSIKQEDFPKESGLYVYREAVVTKSK